MSDTSRTFKVRNPPMRGDDVKAWQHWCSQKLATYGAHDYPLSIDGIYGHATRSATASICHAMGLSSASEAMEDGVTPELRTKLRNARLTADEIKRADDRMDWRKKFVDRYNDADVSPPLARILESSWGWAPGHDGVDLICRPRAAGLAICRGRIIRAENSGWWGKGAPSASIAAKGDGVVVLRSMTNVGPFKVGLNFVYGHAEHVRVREGEVVEAGQVICEAGLANAWHFHFCVNDRSDDKGVGDRDPMPYVRYALKHG